MTTATFTRTTHRPDGTLLIVAPRPPSTFATFARRVGRSLDQIGLAISGQFFPSLMRAAADLEASLASVSAGIRADIRDQIRRANDPVRVAGLEGRYYVRAAMDPSYATPEALHQLVSRLLAGDGDYDPDLARLAPEGRRVVAVSAMRGWAHREPGGETLIVHRLWGTSAVVVRCG